MCSTAPANTRSCNIGIVMKFEDVEKIRESYNHKKRKIWRLTLVIVLVITLFMIPIFLGSEVEMVFISPFLISFVGFLIIVAFFLSSVTTAKDADAYRKAYKAYFVEKELHKYFTGVKYWHDVGLSKNTLLATGMIPTGDSYSSNDLVIAKYKEVGFAQADVCIKVEHTDSEGDTYYVTIFRGRFMIFEFPKKFDFRMMILGRRNAVVRNSGQYIKKFRKIETESSKFNKTFSVYAEDGVEAFYILDPAFIEKIQSIGDRHQNKVQFYFFGNKLFVGLNDGNDSFEPPKPSSRINEKEEIKKVAEEIEVVIDFVNKLRLSRGLFIK